ncbi:FMN-linked oxidoreductase [Periconia macrospinosa]|uniref:Dihydroorotate dehydrogenase (fumarate) n=1 Tax=Periconia macrospinosa TaxID=97972 RepID=A0A2V1EGP2_9PLEO|nr:FMN-linked oxidoreductase [Periconia macrospinosa]
MKQLNIHPRLLNSANPWCTTLGQLQELYSCIHTGAVTTRTSLLTGFPTDPSHHQYTFYNPGSFQVAHPNPSGSDDEGQTGSLNTLGYSPIPLKEYLGFIKTISDALPKPASFDETQGHGERSDPKPFIVSITGSVGEVVECYRLISAHRKEVRMQLAMEINLSCPNIPGKPPPAYNSASLLAYLTALKFEIAQQLEAIDPEERSSHIKTWHVPVGIKTPPYTYHDQYQQLIDALQASSTSEPAHLPCPVSFITGTNTLGSSLLLSPGSDAAFHHSLNSADGTSGIGGLAGAPLHPLALGNVYTIKKMLEQHPSLVDIQIIGVGGVENKDGYERMRAVGADAVGVGTALGRRGVKVFEEIVNGTTT